MVELTQVQSSNKRIASTLPAGLVAVFVGGTNGIGELALKAFVKHTAQPRVYIVGRSQEAADRIKSELRQLNTKGEYSFIRADVSLLAGVDSVCKQIKEKESAINLLFQSQGTLVTGTTTSENLHFSTALAHFSRARFIANLLPELQHATGLRRVVSVFAGTKEGVIDMNDFQAWKIPVTSMRGHSSSIITLTMAHFAEEAPTVSFVHDFPGPVKSGIGRGTKGVARVVTVLFKMAGPFIYIPGEEVGERHLFYATSSKYPPTDSDNAGVPLPSGVAVAKGIDGKIGSGVYTVDNLGEEGGPKVVEILGKLRKDGLVEQVWKKTADEFTRITGLEAL